jgi:ribosome-associated heat shock protein Hsp15
MTLQSLRIDKFLWHVRLFKSRSGAQNAVDAGHVRMNGKRLERSSTPVHVGDTITLIRGDAILAVRVICIPAKRGPAADAATCYICL